MDEDRAIVLMERWNTRYPIGTPVEIEMGELGRALGRTSSEAWLKAIGPEEEREWRPAVLISGSNQPIDLTRVKPIRRPELDELDQTMLDRMAEVSGMGIQVNFSLDSDAALALVSQLGLAAKHPANTGVTRNIALDLCEGILSHFPEDIREFYRNSRSGERDVELQAHDWMNDD